MPGGQVALLVLDQCLPYNSSAHFLAFFLALKPVGLPARKSKLSETETAKNKGSNFAQNIRLV